VPGASDVRDFVDALLGARKVLAGVADWQPDAVEGVFRYVRAVEYQGEIAGELTVKAYPRRPTLRFRIILTVGRAIWRLDYSFGDAPHVNSHNRPADLTGEPITEPHYHSWADNRRFAKANALPARLHNARILPKRIRRFEQAFRWFCAQTNIQLTSHDIPDLPKSDRLL
jgi:hypothetical protein